MSPLTCPQFVAQSLKSFGIQVVFGEVGIPITEIAFELQNESVRFISHRSEPPAVYAASCYAYLTTGKTSLPGIALTTGGPGFINGLSGLSHATINRWPLVLIAGSADRNLVGKGSFQELNQIDVLNGNRSICKGTFLIDSIQESRDVLYKAFKLAVSGVPGGVYVDIPTDVLNQTIDIEIAREKMLVEYPKLKDECSIDQDAVVSALKLIANAKFPLIIVGKGAAMSQCENELREFIDLSGIPFLPTPMGRGVISDDHVLSVAAERSRALGEADVVLLLGCRLNWILHFGEPPRWRTDVQFIAIDLDRSLEELEKINILLLGDVKSVINLFNIHGPSLQLKNPASQDWIASISLSAAMRRQKPSAPTISKVSGTMTYTQAFSVIKRQLEELQYSEPDSRITIISEGSKTMNISRVALPVFRPRGRLDAGTWGTMGLGLGYAVAACLADAEPNHYVVGIEGDSALGFSLAELETIVRYKLPIIICVFNNGGVYSGRASLSEEHPPLPTQLSQETNYASIMKAIGGTGQRVTSTEELKTSFEHALRHRIPTLIDILIDPLDGEANNDTETKSDMEYSKY